MEKLLFVPEIMARYHCSAATARTRMRLMQHLEKPLAVTESALWAWENERTVEPTGKKKTARRQPRIPQMKEFHIERRKAE